MKGLLLALALSAGLAAAVLWGLGLCDAPLAVVSAVAGAVCLPAAVRDLRSRGRDGWRWRRPANGTCAECGYSNEGLGAVTCPECGGVLPPSDEHVRKLLAVHGAEGPSECVVCGKRFPEGTPAGAACPGCGSRHRRPSPAPAGR